MHLVVRQEKDLNEGEVAQDLDLSGADIMVLSFSESDLLSVLGAYKKLSRADPAFPSVQVTDLNCLRHPMSVDVYIEKTLPQARVVIVRLLGGVETWRYGLEELIEWGEEEDVPIIILPGHYIHQPVKSQKEEERREEFAHLSTITDKVWHILCRYFDYGGQHNIASALQYMSANFCGYRPPSMSIEQSPQPLPQWGLYRYLQACGTPSFSTHAPKALIVFYRAHMLSGDMEGLLSLGEALRDHGCDVWLVYVASLKAVDIRTAVEQYIRALSPDIVLNGTCFSSRDHRGKSPLSAPNVPIIQLLQPGSTHKIWEKSSRGLSHADLAMQVVLPELDGVIETAPISFRGQARPGLPAHREAFRQGIEICARCALGWLQLRFTAPSRKKLAIILSDYPGAALDEGKAFVAHAVGLDGFESLANILTFLKEDGYDLGGDEVWDAKRLAARVIEAHSRPTISFADYRTYFETLPEKLQQGIIAQWGQPPHEDGAFHHQFLLVGHIVIAVQPPRGKIEDKKASYHDVAAQPSHHYLAFYFWLTRTRDIDAMIHLGTHGTLEWLPGKSVALGPESLPEILIAHVPVLYPFIVNNPGEAAMSRRRISAVMISHMTPPMVKAGLYDSMAELEQLIEEYSQAQGLDQRRCQILGKRILDKAIRTGLLEESGVRPGQDINEEEALSVLDGWLCDVKEMQIRDGLHIFGKNAQRHTQLIEMIKESGAIEGEDWDEEAIQSRLEACAIAEKEGLLHGLRGEFIPAGPAGAPTRGRIDVLPTGRNLYTMDPRVLPTQSAQNLAQAMEEKLLMQHLQKEGEPLRHLVMDLWGSASLRTGGEDLALAFRLMGVKLTYVQATGRIKGFEVTPLVILNRPRVDVTLRVSGLFRDMFQEQIDLFDQAVMTIAQQDREPDEDNPLAASLRGLSEGERLRATARVFGGQAETYGTGIEEMLLTGAWKDKTQLGARWVEGSQWTYGGLHEGGKDITALKHLLGQAQTVIHTQDHAENDILESPCNSAHEGGLAAAISHVGGDASILHGDTHIPTKPRLGEAAQEIARVVRGRVANPKWIEAMQRHGYAGAGEIAQAVDVLHGFAATLPQRFDKQFDLVFSRIISDKKCRTFLKKENPHAYEAILKRFQEATKRGLWRVKSNEISFYLKEIGHIDAP